MKAKQQLRKPENWQDFESLCKKLWGEIWQCKEIKKNGRQGQKQHGVDVYGVPKGEDSYYGIQCKGKDDYTNSQLSEEEIDTEIQKALQFKPELKKLYFATTANKDSKIKEYVRKKDIENRNGGSFEVHLYSWEDIVDLIDENKETHDWYVKSQSCQLNQSIKITFENDADLKELHIPYQRRIISYKLRPKPIVHTQAKGKLDFSNLMFNDPFVQDVSVDKSFGIFNLKIVNVGNTPIENYKIHLEFEGAIRKIVGPPRSRYNSGRKEHVSLNPDTFIDEDGKTGKIIPHEKIFVPNDYVSFDNIIIYPENDAEIQIKWKIVSADFEDTGVIVLRTVTEWLEVSESKFVDSEEEITPDIIIVEPNVVVEKRRMSLY